MSVNFCVDCLFSNTYRPKISMPPPPPIPMCSNPMVAIEIDVVAGNPVGVPCRRVRYELLDTPECPYFKKRYSCWWLKTLIMAVFALSAEGFFIW